MKAIKTTTDKLEHNFFVEGQECIRCELTYRGTVYLSDSVVNKETNQRLHLLKKPKGKKYFHAVGNIEMTTMSKLYEISKSHLCI